jgi:hypothetical protein
MRHFWFQDSVVRCFYEKCGDVDCSLAKPRSSLKSRSMRSIFLARNLLQLVLPIRLACSVPVHCIQNQLRSLVRTLAAGRTRAMQAIPGILLDIPVHFLFRGVSQLEKSNSAEVTWHKYVLGLTSTSFSQLSADCRKESPCWEKTSPRPLVHDHHTFRSEIGVFHFHY